MAQETLGLACDLLADIFKAFSFFAKLRCPSTEKWKGEVHIAGRIRSNGRD
jgi:hypothetical protein